MARNSLTVFVLTEKQIISLYEKTKGIYLDDHFFWDITRKEKMENTIGPECMVTWK